MTGFDESLTRRSLLARAGFVAAPLVLGGPLLRARAARAAAPPRTLVVGAAQLAQARRNVFSLNLPFARRAWGNTLAKANGLLSYQPSPTPRNADVSDWFKAIYHPGLLDGSAAMTLASAYAIGQRRDHADRAKAICLAWARTYNPAPPRHLIAHMVAEPVGPVIKLCMAYDLVKATMSSSERRDFASWAEQFIERGKISADSARDDPWWPEVIYNGEPSSPATYSNSATWQRAMAVWAAAAAGDSALNDTLSWNFQHTTGKGRDYGWDNLLEGMIIDGTGGQLVEQRYRASVHYAHFGWAPLILIADVARNARFRVDLFDYRTRKNGYTLFTPVSYYAKYLVENSIPDELERTDKGGSAWPEAASRFRALYEILYRNAKTPANVKALSKVVGWGGPSKRGDNFDIYVAGYAALFGRGPKGPGPSAPR